MDEEHQQRPMADVSAGYRQRPRIASAAAEGKGNIRPEKLRFGGYEGVHTWICELSSYALLRTCEIAGGRMQRMRPLSGEHGAAGAAGANNLREAIGSVLDEARP